MVASRLSEMPCVTVLLLEAGPEPPILTEVPRFSSSFSGTTVDWHFKTTPQKYAAFAHKQRVRNIVLLQLFLSFEYLVAARKF